MKLLYFLGGFLFFCFSSLHLYAAESEAMIQYQKFETAIESRYTSEQNAEILRSVQKRLLDMSYENSSTERRKALETIISLHHESLYKQWKEKELSQQGQKEKEAKERNALVLKLQNIKIPGDFESLLSAERSFLATNEKGEFFKEESIFKIQYQTFFPVLSSTLESLKKKKGIIILSGEGDYRFIESYTFEKKIPYSELSAFFAGFFTSNFRIIEKKGAYYGYLFEKYRFYEESYGAYEKQLIDSGFERETTYLYQDVDGRYNFVSDYTERKLASVTDMFGVSQKELFLKYMLSDAKHLSSDISKNMQAIKTIAVSLPRGANAQETTANIYDWILKNISYTDIVNLQDTRMFSAGEALQVKNGVCTAYAKLFVYLMLYKNLYDIEVIEGQVIDAVDFPKIGHAWVRYQEKYYDPTFDDPIGAKTTREPKEYRYFGLPRDIFYINRFHYEDLPDIFKTASSEQISQYIFNGLSNLLTIYGDTAYEYLVFAPVKFRNTYNISANTVLTPELLAQKIGSYRVEDNNFSFQKDGKTLNISGLRYYPLTGENTQSSLDVLNYDIADMTLFDWELADGSREWRLAYELTTR